MMDLFTQLAMAWLVFWLHLYAYAAKNQRDPFWYGFLRPFG